MKRLVVQNKLSLLLKLLVLQIKHNNYLPVFIKTEFTNELK